MWQPLCIDADQAFGWYPQPTQVDAWAAGLLAKSNAVSIRGTLLKTQPIRQEFGNGPNTLENRFVKFEAGDGRRPFYGYWQPAAKTPAPLLVNLPGYGGYVNLHPQLCDLGYNVLHISPQGYVGPRGAEKALQLPDGNWPVLPLTAEGLPGGYADWLGDCLLAIRWAQARPEVQPGRLSLYGTSQGGGTALLLAAILGKEVRWACADLPFLTGFPLTGLAGPAYGLLQEPFTRVEAPRFWNRLGYADTLSHAHRLAVPVMLTAGGADDTCPAGTVEALFQKLRCTKQLTWLQEGVHTHSRQSMVLFAAWMQLYA